MPRYFFHVGNTEPGLDHEGMELRDYNAARIESARMMGQILKDRAGEFWDDRTMKLIVTDENGLVLFILDLSGIEAPAVSRRA